jgi:uncharacterized membrane protein YfcA
MTAGLVLVGVVAGAITTLAGAGGGLMLMVLLAWLRQDPVEGLAIATPALLVGNLHRLWWYWRELPMPLAPRYTGAVFLGALLGGSLLVSLPPQLVQASLVVAAILAVLTELAPQLRVPAGQTVALGLGVGVASATGGAGILSAPVLQASGLRGGAYLAALSAGAVAMHVGRGLMLGAAGRMEGQIWLAAMGLALGLPLGNMLGAWVRARVSDKSLGRVEIFTSTSIATMSVLGCLP